MKKTEITEKRMGELRAFKKMLENFNAIAQNNKAKGKAKATAAFYFMQGIAQAQIADGSAIDPVLWVALLRNDINGLAYIDEIEKEK
jgi:hypothetical protein